MSNTPSHILTLQSRGYCLIKLYRKRTIMAFRRDSDLKLIHCLDDNEHCLRGLENFLNQDQMDKHLKKRKAAIHSVLDEADTQLSYASNDPEKIRKCLKKSSKNSVQRAYNLGAIGFVGKVGCT